MATTSPTIPLLKVSGNTFLIMLYDPFITSCILLPVEETNMPRSVVDWVKWRYQAMGAYAIVLFVGAIIGSLAADPTLLVFSAIGGTILSLISIVLQYLVWIMPKAFQLYINRNYKPVQINTEISEEELLKMLG